MDDLLAKHRKEAKELQGTITGMKKSVGSDKKKKKELPDQIAALEVSLKQRQAAEVAALQAEQEEANPVVEEEEQPDIESLSIAEPAMITKKPNRQQQRKARKAANFEEERQKALLEAAGSVNMRQVEEDSIAGLLTSMKLRVKQVVADGHCLYNAMSDQHALVSQREPLGYAHYRKQAATFMRAHPDEFMPFLATDDGDIMSEEQYEQYCCNVEASATWGGQLEIKAMTMALKRPVHIVQMGTPVVKVGEEFEGEPLMLSLSEFTHFLQTFS
ncbi:OTU domain-containing protein 6B [Podochytrium sp. JEL0797]|nr:OTU domain-containing protein 6B [Podochytrium sp. JEL0797]